MDKDLEIYIEMLKDEWAVNRMEAAGLLGRVKYERAIPALIEAAKDDNPQVKGAVDKALQNIGKPAVPALIDAVGHEYPQVRAVAVSVLGEIGDASAVPALREALKADLFFGVRAGAAWALGKIGDASVVPALIEALKDLHFVVRGEVVGALGKIIKKCKTMEELEEIEKGIGDYSTELRKERVDKTTFIKIQIKVAMILREIAQMKDEFAPKRDLLLDDKPKPPKKGRGVYQALRKCRY